MAGAVLRLPEVIRRCGLSRTPIYAAIQRDEFPKPVKLSDRAVGWLETEIDEWVSSRPRQGSDQSAAMAKLRRSARKEKQ